MRIITVRSNTSHDPPEDSELESIINAIRLGFSEVEIDSRGTEHRACDTGISRQRLAEGSDSL